MSKISHAAKLILTVVAGTLLSCGGSDVPPPATQFQVQLRGPERLCTSDGNGYQWCHQNAVTGTESIRSIHGVPGGVMWFAQGGNLWGTTTGGSPYHLEYRNDAATIEGVHVVSDTEAWAVGSTWTKERRLEPLLLRWDGKRWDEASVCGGYLKCLLPPTLRAVDLMGRGVSLRGVYAVGGVVWVVGDNPLYNRSAIWRIERGLVTQEYSGVYIRAVWGLDTANVWAVGDGGTILKWDGTTGGWEPQASGTSEYLFSVWGLDTANVWAVGDGGTILKWNGDQWVAQVSSTSYHLNSVWGSDASNVWAVGEMGTILKWNGTAWTTQKSGTTGWLSSVWGSDASNIWAVSEIGTMLKWDGGKWEGNPSRFFSENYNVIHTVRAFNPNEIWAIGDCNQEQGSPMGTTIFTWDSVSNTWKKHSFVEGICAYSIWKLDQNNVWAVGYNYATKNATILKWDGMKWTQQASGLAERLNSMWGSDANNVWAVGGSGEKGKILKWNGMKWEEQQSDTTSYLGYVWGSDASNVWAVGDKGVILKRDGMKWTQQASDLADNVYSVWGTDANNVWAVGERNMILKWNGMSNRWEKQRFDLTQGTFTHIHSIWGSDANNVWAVGGNGAVLKWNGTAWADQPSGTHDSLNSVWGTDADNVWAVAGTYGAVLKREKEPSLAQ